MRLSRPRSRCTRFRTAWRHPPFCAPGAQRRGNAQDGHPPAVHPALRDYLYKRTTQKRKNFLHLFPSVPFHRRRTHSAPNYSYRRVGREKRKTFFIFLAPAPDTSAGGECPPILCYRRTSPDLDRLFPGISHSLGPPRHFAPPYYLYDFPGRKRKCFFRKFRFLPARLARRRPAVDSGAPPFPALHDAIYNIPAQKVRSDFRFFTHVVTASSAAVQRASPSASPQSVSFRPTSSQRGRNRTGKLSPMPDVRMPLASDLLA